MPLGTPATKRPRDPVCSSASAVSRAASLGGVAGAAVPDRRYRGASRAGARAPPDRQETAMTMDQSKLGQVVAEQMEAIEEDHGEECEIGDVCVIVEVLCPDESTVRVRSSDRRPHIRIGLLMQALRMELGS
jgi:predicted homoserine dehydrogenase-like protein